MLFVAQHRMGKSTSFPFIELASPTTRCSLDNAAPGFACQRSFLLVSTTTIVVGDFTIAAAHMYWVSLSWSPHGVGALSTTVITHLKASGVVGLVGWKESLHREHST